MTNPKSNPDRTFDILSDIIDDLFSSHFKKDTKKMQTEPMKPAPVEEQSNTPMYESIEDYTAKTGKRFRMTKNQKELGFTREEAFNETFGGKN